MIDNFLEVLNFITIFKSITMLYGTNNIPQNISNTHSKCEEYSIEYYQSHITLEHCYGSELCYVQPVISDT
jgi:hypothetical protein